MSKSLSLTDMVRRDIAHHYGDLSTINLHISANRGANKNQFVEINMNHVSIPTTIFTKRIEGRIEVYDSEQIDYVMNINNRLNRICLEMMEDLEKSYNTPIKMILDDLFFAIHEK